MGTEPAAGAREPLGSRGLTLSPGTRLCQGPRRPLLLAQTEQPKVPLAPSWLFNQTGPGGPKALLAMVRTESGAKGTLCNRAFFYQQMEIPNKM